MVCKNLYELAADKTPVVARRRLGMEKTMRKLCLVVFVTVFVVIMFSFSPFVALAQYETTKTADFTIPSSGTSHIDLSTTPGGVSIDISGTIYATGLVSAAAYAGNPQPHASWPVKVTLTRFVDVTISMDASYFKTANLTISYSNSDVVGINPPYSLYKYDSESNTYVPRNSTVDDSAKTITTTLASVNDPLFAIGGTTAVVVTPTPVAHSNQQWIWLIVATVIIIIALTAALLIFRRKASNA